MALIREGSETVDVPHRFSVRETESCRPRTGFTMRKELEAVPVDIHFLAQEACRTAEKSTMVEGNGSSKPHDNLQAGLAQVRGMAVQQAKAANVRLRRRAV